MIRHARFVFAALLLTASGSAASELRAQRGGVRTGAQAGAQSTAPAIPPADLMRHVSVLAADSMEGRLIGSAGSAKARRYLLAQFAAAGLQPIGSSFEHPFSVPVRDTIVRSGVNLVGVVRGTQNPERYIVVTAHYDHVGVRQGQVFNGADDNASGTAAIVEMARRIRANPPLHSIIFVALDGEEGGLTGAREFVRDPPVPATRIVMNVNLDMVGRNEKNELYAAGTSHYPYLRPYLDSVATRSAITLRMGHDDPNGPRGDDWTTQSDHGAFHRAGIPFIYFGVEDHPDYHKATDDTERLMPEFFARAAATVLDAVRTFDRNLAAIAVAQAPVRLLTFNIRYGTANDGDHRWPNRRAHVITTIRDHAPHLLGIQEALRAQLDEIGAAFPGYRELGVGRDDGLTRGEYAALLVDTARFAILSNGHFWYSDTPDVPGSKHWGNNVTRICTWARLVDRATGDTIRAYNSHWDHESQPSREKAAAMLLDRAAAAPSPNDLVLLFADFNSGEDNPAFKALISDTRVPLRDTFRAVHPNATVVGTFNAFRGDSTRDKIDAILASPEWRVLDAAIDRRRFGALWASDHFAVSAIVRAPAKGAAPAQRPTPQSASLASSPPAAPPSSQPAAQPAAQTAPVFAPVHPTEMALGASFTNAWADFDGDGWPDLFVGFNGATPNRLYRNDRGTALLSVERSAPGGEVTDARATRAAAWGDFDSDGDPDLLVGFTAGDGGVLRLYRNDGGRFANATVAAGLTVERGAVRQVSWIDVDGDGDLDLFVAFRDQANALFINDGGRFTNRAAERGLADTSRTVGAVWFDYDADGDLDVLVANMDGQPNALMRNDGARFTAAPMRDSALAWGGRTPRDATNGTVRPCAADVDGDGQLDVFFANYGRNGLFLNRGGGAFEDVSERWGIAIDARYDACAFADFDNDGRLDLYVNGTVTGGTNYRDYLFRNTGTRYEDVTPANIAELKADHGVQWADYNRDGAVDLALTGAEAVGMHQVLRNVMSPDRAARAVSVLVTDAAGRATLPGAEIRVYVAGTRQLIATRLVDTGSGYDAQSAGPVHVGVGAAARVDIEATYPMGGRRVVGRADNVDVAAVRGQHVTVRVATR